MKHDYQPPVDKLLTLGLEGGNKWDWPDYLAMGFTEKDVPELIHMATDEPLNNADDDSPEVWAPVMKEAYPASGMTYPCSATGKTLTLNWDYWMSRTTPVPNYLMDNLFLGLREKVTTEQ